MRGGREQQDERKGSAKVHGWRGNVGGFCPLRGHPWLA
jgi:hypothetical protein